MTHPQETQVLQYTRATTEATFGLKRFLKDGASSQNGRNLIIIFCRFRCILRPRGIFVWYHFFFAPNQFLGQDDDDMIESS